SHFHPHTPPRIQSLLLLRHSSLQNSSRHLIDLQSYRLHRNRQGQHSFLKYNL
ncbi:hypothetical protein PISMIDRAFT_688058, partial [Pisolithus microcarpus 441]